MISLDHNTSYNGRAAFNAPISSASSTTDLVEPSDNISISTINQMGVRPRANGKAFPLLKTLKNLRSIKFWRSTIQLRLPLFVFVILGLSMVFLIAFFIHSLVFHAETLPCGSHLKIDDGGIGGVVLDASNSSTVEFERLVSEAKETFDEFEAETTRAENDSDYLSNFVHFLEYCLESIKVKEDGETTKNEANNSGGIEATTTSKVTENKKDADKNKEASTITALLTTTLPFEEELEQIRAENRKKARPVCEDMFGWLRLNPWHSTEVLRRRRTELRSYFDDFENRLLQHKK